MSTNNENGSAATMAGLMNVYNSAKEKWDSSGGKEALGRISASIPESTRQMAGALFKKEHLRGPKVFFGIGEERPFYVEKTPSLLAERLRHNMTFFYLNYMVLAGILFCLTLLGSPTRIIGLALLAAAWMGLVRATQDGALHITSSISIPQKTAAIGMGVISIIVVFNLLSSIFWWTLMSTGLLVATHVLLRDASMHKDMDDAMAMEGDLQIGRDVAFEVEATQPYVAYY